MKTDSGPITGSSPSAPSAQHNWRVERFRSLYDANYDDLWRYCLRRSANASAAEDALSETMTVAWRKLEQIPEPPGARPWLFGIARNQLRNDWRKAKRGADLVTRVATQTPETASDDPATIAADGSDQILAALAELKPADQELLRLAAWENLSHREIAEILGCSENAVNIRLHRARDRLATKLSKTRELHKKPKKNRKVSSPQDTLLTSEPDQEGRSHE